MSLKFPKELMSEDILILKMGLFQSSLMFLGIVDRYFVEEGSEVKKGQVLFIISNPIFQEQRNANK